jgi:hypothetical protein
MRDTREIFKLIENIKEISKNVNLYVPIYPDVSIEVGNVEFSEKYKVSFERADREVVKNIKTSVRPYHFNKRRKLTRS